MPHAGLMDEEALGPEAGPLMRAKLHIRGGRRRLRQGKISAGIVTFYDAVSAAMEWYVASAKRLGRLTVREDDNLKDDHSLYDILVRAGVLDGSFHYREFDTLVQKALYEDIVDYDYAGVLGRIEAFMTQLGVMPFAEEELPPEDPSTF